MWINAHFRRLIILWLQVRIPLGPPYKTKTCAFLPLSFCPICQQTVNGEIMRSWFYGLLAFFGLHQESSTLPAPVLTTSKVIMEQVATMPQWETIQPKSKAECLHASDGALNPVFVRCHYGYQELVTYDSKGHRKVIQDRPIPVSGIPR